MGEASRSVFSSPAKYQNLVEISNAPVPFNIRKADCGFLRAAGKHPGRRFALPRRGGQSTQKPFTTGCYRHPGFPVAGKGDTSYSVSKIERMSRHQVSALGPEEFGRRKSMPIRRFGFFGTNIILSTNLFVY
jgi:hypothetical protein